MAVRAESYNAEDLTLVFGASSFGGNPMERAASSSVMFVRGQVQLAIANERAKGWKITATQALDAYGWDALLQVCREGTFVLVSKIDEPACTLKQARERLGLSIEAIAKSAGLTSASVQKAETVGSLSPMRDLIALSQPLALDAAFLSFEAGAHGDGDLGVRLRELSENSDTQRFTQKSVLEMTEAGWTIYEHSKIALSLGFVEDPLASKNNPKDNNYHYPAYDQGYRLARKTRGLLALGDAPIKSLRSFIENDLKIPLVQQVMDSRFAGATISVGGVRGIVVNVQGRNQNVWVRRMTLCHELGHLLWDPEQRLNKLRVDEYDQIETDVTSNKNDVVEIRANAFAIAFLAPPDAVFKIVSESETIRKAVEVITDTFGISVTAARYHIRNVCNIEVPASATYGLAEPSAEWTAAENFTVDYFPLKNVPLSRRGRFAWLVMKGVEKNVISMDTACSFLKESDVDISRNQSLVLELLAPEGT